MRTSLVEQIKLRETMATVDSIVDLARTNPCAFAEQFGNKSVAEIIAPLLPKEEKVKVVKQVVDSKPKANIRADVLALAKKNGVKAKKVREHKPKETKKTFISYGRKITVYYTDGVETSRVYGALV